MPLWPSDHAAGAPGGKPAGRRADGALHRRVAEDDDDDDASTPGDLLADPRAEVEYERTLDAIAAGRRVRQLECGALGKLAAAGGDRAAW